MKLKQTIKTAIGVGLFSMTALMSGCLEKDLYDSNMNQEPTADDFFGFETRANTSLSIDYNAPGFWAYVEIFDEYPLVTTTSGEGESQTIQTTKKEKITPIYNAYVKDGKFQTNIANIPTKTKKAYLYTESFGLPTCVELNVTNEGLVYNAKAKASTRSTGFESIGTDGNKAPFKATPTYRTDNLFSLSQWDYFGATHPDFLHDTSLSDIGGLTIRVQEFIDKNKAIHGNSKNLIKNVNIVIPAGGSEVDITFVQTFASYGSTFGYYYYEKGEKAPTSSKEFSDLKKFIIFPDSKPRTNGSLKTGDTAKLKYYGKSGNEAETNVFPEGCTIGWFLIPEGFNFASGGINTKAISDLVAQGIFKTCFSDDSRIDRKQFMSLFDKKTQTVVIGVEDLFGPKEQTHNKSDYDYNDLLFYATTTKSIDPDDRPSIDEPTPDPTPQVAKIAGTLAFEDIWPTGGDYDLNDVAVEYERAITFNSDNKAISTVETFKFIHRADAAAHYNYFAYQVKNAGQVTLKENCVEEKNTNSIIITESAKNSTIGNNREYVVSRTYSEGERVSKDELINDFNPYIIVCDAKIEGGYEKANRKEVHLPKHLPTSMADASLNNTGDDAYYIHSKGSFPFAVELPVSRFDGDKKTMFDLSPERIRIDSTYPRFASWASSNGKDDQDWYVKK